MVLTSNLGAEAFGAKQERAVGFGASRADDPAAREEKALARARDARRGVPRGLGVVLFAGAGAGVRLRAIAAGNTAPPPSDFARRAALARLALTGRWWVGR